MPKIAMGLGAAMGIWGVGMGTTAIANGFGSVELKKMSFNPKNVKLTTSEDIKGKYMELPCIGELFKGIKWSENEGTAKVSFSTDEKTEGCISVRWEKETYNNDKWKGNWNLLWGMKSDVSGMIFSSDIRTKDGKMVENTFFYTLQQTQNEWTAVSIMTFKEQEIKEGERNNIVFPKEELITSHNGWDFDFLSKDICASGKGCESEIPKLTSANLNWNFVNGNKPETRETTYAYSWIKDINSWLFFGSNITNYLSKVVGYFELVSPTEI